MPKKRADGRYELKVKVSKPNEPRRYKAVYGSTLREAQERKRKLEAEIAAGIEASQRATVSDLTKYFLDLRSADLRPQTISNYGFALAHITDLVGERQAKEITVDDARNAIRIISAEISPNQGLRARKIACMVWDDAITRSVLTANPWRAVPVPKHTAADKRYLTEGELKKIDKADLIPQDRALINVLRYTGMRIGEATALTVGDVDFKSGFITVNKTNASGHIFPPKTKAGERRIPMPKVLQTALKNYVEEYIEERDDDLLFATSKGRTWSHAEIWRRFEAIKKAVFGDDAPPDFTPHIFRHTYTHDLVAAGIPPLTAQVLLGHSSYAITLKVYAHFGWNDVAHEDVTNIFDKNKSSSKRSSNHRKTT